jgi:hypothetical protein
MTPTETIAVKLFGWLESRPADPDEDGKNVRKIYFNAKGEEAYLLVDGTYSDDGINDALDEWPDLTDWNWIRRMEDALAEKGLFVQYAGALSDIVPAEECKPKGLFESPADLIIFVGLALGMYATPAQRVSACLRVIEDAGL